MFFTPRKLGVTLGLGVVLALVGGVVLIFWPAICDRLIDKELVIKNGSLSYKMWKVTPIPLYLRVYFFNCTNSKDVLETPHAKPNLVELGPYTFRGKRIKMDLDWTENSTIKYYQNTTWFFEPSMSNGTLDDIIMSLDVPGATAAYLVRDNWKLKFMLDLYFGVLRPKVFVAKPVRELLFEGYDDKILDLAREFHIPGMNMPYDKFGWFYPRNGSKTYDGYFEMHTGADDIQKLATLVTWNNVSETSYYEPGCNKVNGSEGELFPPRLKKDEISIFFPDICRPMKLPYLEEMELYDVRGYKYAVDKMLFANKSMNPHNWCYSQKGESWPNGILDVSKCKFGAPAFVSLPHFLYADPSYVKSVKGLKPEPEKHRMFLDIHPESGVPMKISARLQVNILLEPIKGVLYYRDVPKIVFPMLWFKMDAQINEELMDLLRTMLSVEHIVPIVLYVIFGVGLTLLVTSSILFIWLCIQKKSEDTMILVDE